MLRVEAFQSAGSSSGFTAQGPSKQQRLHLVVPRACKSARRCCLLAHTSVGCKPTAAAAASAYRRGSDDMSSSAWQSSPCGSAATVRCTYAALLCSFATAASAFVCACWMAAAAETLAARSCLSSACQRLAAGLLEGALPADLDVLQCRRGGAISCQLQDGAMHLCTAIALATLHLPCETSATILFKCPGTANRHRRCPPDQHRPAVARPSAPGCR